MKGGGRRIEISSTKQSNGGKPRCTCRIFGGRRLILESLASITATATWSSTIALILKDKGECKLHSL